MTTQIKFRRRLLATILAVAFFFCIVAGKLCYIQLYDGRNLQARALDQWTRDVPLRATRGGIYDRNGVLLAGTDTAYTLYVRPVEVADKEGLAAAIADVLYLDRDAVSAKINKKGASEVTVAKRVTKEQMVALIATGRKGMYFSRDIKRYYPYGNFMCQLLGFTDADTLGQTGLELYYDDYLKGLDGYQLTEADIRGRSIADGIAYIPAVEGLDLTLTVDKSIQYFAESAVENAYLKYQAKGAACVVMDDRGGVVAVAEAPNFDLNNVPRDDLATLFATSKISATTNVYEMGSTFKIITLAAAVNEGVARLDDTFYCAGSKEVDGQRIKCWKSKGHGSQTLGEAVQNSCNCAFMELALRVGTQKMYEYFRSFCLTEKTGVDISGEASGLLLKEEDVKTVDLARIGFGQAIAVTPMELVRAVTACVNGGTLYTPHVMDVVTDAEGRVAAQFYPKGVEVLKKSTSETVRNLLLGVVNGGSGRLAGVEGYEIGGKTGTAQKYKNGGIDRGKYLSSFIGFLSAGDRQYVCLLYVDEPQGYLYYGSQVAAPFVGDIFRNTAAYLDLVPTESVQPLETFVMPDLMGKSYGEVQGVCRHLGIYLEASGEGGAVTYQFPVAGAECTAKCVLYVDMG